MPPACLSLQSGTDSTKLLRDEVFRPHQIVTKGKTALGMRRLRDTGINS